MKDKSYYKAKAAKALANQRLPLEAFRTKVFSLVAEAKQLAEAGPESLRGEGFSGSKIGQHLASQVEGVRVSAETSVKVFCDYHVAELWKQLNGLKGDEWNSYHEALKPLSQFSENK